ncbi:hypothetical protein ACA910_004523 [Epithemia clementina (nom. ined.)]
MTTTSHRVAQKDKLPGMAGMGFTTTLTLLMLAAFSFPQQSSIFYAAQPLMVAAQPQYPLVSSIRHRRLQVTPNSSDSAGDDAPDDDRAVDDIRFNKCSPVLLEEDARTYWRYQYSPEYTNGVHRNVYPLLPHDYPLKAGEYYDLLRTQTRADSPIVLQDIALHGKSFAEYSTFIHEPYYPSSDPTNPYWGELEHLVDLQIARRANKDPNDYSRWPDLWSGFNMTRIAVAVMNEYPGSLQQEIIAQTFKAGIVVDYDVMTFRSVVDIVGQQFLIAKLNTWAVERVAAISFLAKWHYGVARPEEMAWLIALGVFTAADGVPQGLIDKIKSMNLKQPEEFTAYPKGCPNHPSWPAMHAAASSCSIWMPIILHLTADQYCEALRVDYAVAYARFVAGVHYKMDNFAGLNLGQRIVMNEFPPYMAEMYGCDADIMMMKFEFLSFDWHDFDPYECTIEGVPVGDRLQAYNEFFKGQREAKEKKEGVN